MSKTALTVSALTILILGATIATTPAAAHIAGNPERNEMHEQMRSTMAGILGLSVEEIDAAHETHTMRDLIEAQDMEWEDLHEQMQSARRTFLKEQGLTDEEIDARPHRDRRGGHHKGGMSK